MCWIHGGGFLSGSGNSDWYGPDYLLKENVVLVTINYRLGILGFLNFDNPALDVPGNAGFKDQVMALRWIQENIRCFGGDPNNVTIFGNSSGGISVHLLVLSSLAKGLFHKAIMQSGTALGSWSDGKRSVEYLEIAFNIKASEETFLKLLQKMPIEEIMELQSKIPDICTAYSQRPFGPVVESYTSKSSFILEEPLTILRSGTYNDVSLMIGYTSRECLLIHFMNRNANVPNKGLDIITDFEMEIPRTLNVIKGTSLSKRMAEKIKFFYLGNKEWADEIKSQYYLLKTDNMFIWPIQKNLRYHAKSSTNPTYFYRMSIDTSINLFKRSINIKLPGVSHGDELGYLFKRSRIPPPLPNSLEMNGIERFTKLWTNFARTGNPNPTECTSLIDVHWKPIDKCNLHYLDIGENLTVGVNPDENRVRFWNELEILSLGDSKL
ncbi:hypothetical protein PPYR_01381 [Photinus pyralis]|nr:esterase B1-like [Photinus pyralis]KAB0804411.1 hypothetical protein PPYR_01381 [Photinus pyralis]